MKLLKLTAFVATFAFCAAVPNFLMSEIKKMHILETDIVKESKTLAVSLNSLKEHRLFKYLRSNSKSSHTDSVSQVGSFKWQDCGSSSELLHLFGLAITPDPLKLPGDVGLKFAVLLKETVNAPLKCVLELQKHEGPLWITIPCIDGIGSCTYDDLCDILSGAVCPQPFDDHSIPCKCPFAQGNYSLPSSTFPIDVGSIPSGDYYGKAQLSYQSQQVVCFEVYFSVD